MSYDLLRHIDIDLGEIGDSLQIDLNREQKILRLTVFKQDHYQDQLRIDLEDEFGSSEYVDCEYSDAVDGDIYLNPMFGDLWIVEDNSFIKINDGYTIELDEPSGFIKVGHVDGVVSKRVEDIFGESKGTD